MPLKSKIDELKKRKEEVLQGGGEQAIAKQTAMGKLTARERVIALLDEDSFHEYDLFVEHEARDFGMDGKVLHGDGGSCSRRQRHGPAVLLHAVDVEIIHQLLAVHPEADPVITGGGERVRLRKFRLHKAGPAHGEGVRVHPRHGRVVAPIKVYVSVVC